MKRKALFFDIDGTLLSDGPGEGSVRETRALERALVR